MDPGRRGVGVGEGGGRATTFKLYSVQMHFIDDTPLPLLILDMFMQ